MINKHSTIPPKQALSRRKSTQYRLDIDPQTWQDFFNRVRNGISFNSCCYGAGLKPANVQTWLSKGQLLSEEDLPPQHSAWQYVRFWQEFQKSRAEFESLHRANINNHATAKSPGVWTASAWSLERFDPDTYGDRYIIEKKSQEKLNTVLQALFTMGDLEFREKLAHYLQLFPDVKLRPNADPDIAA